MAFNATSQVSYYYSPWQPSPGSVALPSSTTSHRNETPFRPSPHGLQAPTRLPPSLLSLSLLLSPVSPSAPFLYRSVDTLVYSFSEARTGRQVSVIVSRVAGRRGREGERKRRRRRNVSQARLWIAGSGGPCWFSTKSTAPEMGPIVLLATNRWLHGATGSPRGRKIRQ